MIIAKELRIGNIIKAQTGEIITCKAINIYEIATGLYQAESIPLTEQWLIKFGFLKDDRKSKYSMLSTVYFLGYGLKLWSIIDGTRFRHDFNCDYLDGLNIDYVHQLQNLVFSLTNKELKLSANEKKTTS